MSLQISVNALPITRNAWRDVGERTGVPAIDITVVCTDTAEHRRRVETRETDFRRLTWDEVMNREFAAPGSNSIVIDTAHHSVEQSLAALSTALRDDRSS